MTENELNNSIEELHRNSQIRDLLGIQLKVKSGQVPDLINEFELWNKANGDYKQQSKSDFTRHFLNWARKKASNPSTINLRNAYGTNLKQQEFDEWLSDCQERVVSVLASGGYTIGDIHA